MRENFARERERERERDSKRERERERERERGGERQTDRQTDKSVIFIFNPLDPRSLTSSQITMQKRVLPFIVVALLNSRKHVKKSLFSNSRLLLAPMYCQMI